MIQMKILLILWCTIFVCRTYTICLQTATLPDFDPGWWTWNQLGACQPCDHLWRLLEPFPRHPVNIPCLPLWSDQTCLRLQVPCSGRLHHPCTINYVNNYVLC